jgi:hypothetical protein
MAAANLQPIGDRTLEGLLTLAGREPQARQAQFVVFGLSQARVAPYRGTDGTQPFYGFPRFAKPSQIEPKSSALRTPSATSVFR